MLYFFLPALIVIWSQKNDRWARLVTFYSVSVVTILAGLVTFGYIATSSFSISEMYDWSRGYLGDPLYGTYFKLESIPVAWKTALGTVLAPTYGRARFVRIAIYSFLIAIASLGITQIRLLGRDKKIVLLSAFLQCLVSWLLIIWFEPWYPKFWLLTLVPAMIFLACCAHALEKRVALWFNNLLYYQKYYSPLLVILGLIVATFNIKYAILNQHNPDQTSQESMNMWLEHSNPDDMLITAGDLIGPLWFWANRPNTIHLYHYLSVNEDSEDRFEYLRDQIDHFLCDGNAVIFAPAIVDNFHEPFLLWLDLPREDLGTFFDAYQKESYFTYRNLDNGEVTQVYKLVNPSACDD